MKVFKIYTGEFYYGYFAKTEEQAIEQYKSDEGDHYINSIEEIPESEWDERNISMWEDNDMSTEPFKVSIRELIVGDSPQQLFTNDINF